MAALRQSHTFQKQLCMPSLSIGAHGARPSVTLVSHTQHYHVTLSQINSHHEDSRHVDKNVATCNQSLWHVDKVTAPLILKISQTLQTHRSVPHSTSTQLCVHINRMAQT